MAELNPAIDLTVDSQTHAQKEPLSDTPHAQHAQTLPQLATQHPASPIYAGTDPEKGNVDDAEPSPISSIQDCDDAQPDSNLVDWDGPDDPEKPTNWADSRKYSIIVLISTVTFLTYESQSPFQAALLLTLASPLASSMFAPGIPEVMTEFGSDNVELASFVVSVYILGYAFGPMFVAPASERYGRLPTYHVCNTLFVVFTIACAVSSNLNMLVTWRFFAGLFGSCPLTIGGGTIADMIIQEKRGAMMSIFAMGPIMGPVIGPVAGGYLAQAKGWRWVFWLIAIVAGAITLFSFIFLRETYPPILLERKAKKLRSETNNNNLRGKYTSDLPPLALFKRAIFRPLKLLFLSPIVLALSTFMAVVYGYLYLLFTTLTVVFESTYGFSSGSVGLTFLGIGIGCLFGLFIFGGVSDRILKAKSKNGEMKPEYRLPPMIPGAFIIPIGLFLYGWTAEERVHWIVPIIGTGFVGLGLLATFLPVITYLVDAFPIYAASATAASTIFRSLLGALLPLAGRSMYNTLGLGWGNSLLAFISVALCPIPIVLYKYGERIRKHPRFQVTL
ncbi:MAG: hypothetical protein Q9210_006048 [Variospora velana]